MDKGAYQQLHTPVTVGEALPGAPEAVSLLSRVVLDLASPLQGTPATGGPSSMVIRAQPAEVLTTNAYCSTCLQTRRFIDLPTHMVCETCSKRLDKLSPERGSRMSPEPR